MVRNIDLKKINYTSLLEDIFLLMTAFLIAYYFLCNTMFQISWPLHFSSYLRSLTMLIVFFRLATMKKDNMKEVFFMVLIAFVFYTSYINDSSSAQIVDMALLILGSYHIRIEKIAKVYLITTCALVSVTIFSAVTGLIVNSVYVQNEGTRVRYCLGTSHYFWMTAYIFYMTCAYLIIRQTNIRYIELIILETINIIFYLLCRGRNHLICITVMLGCVFFMKMSRRLNRIGLYDTIAGCLIPLSCALFSIIAIVFYSEDSILMRLLNSLLSSRLSLGKTGYDALGFSVWGKKIVTYGWSKNGVQYSSSSNAFVIDSGYFFTAVKYGIVVLGVFLLILLWMNYQACAAHNKILLLVLCINACQFIIDRDMFYINCDFLLWCAFASCYSSEHAPSRAARHRHKEGYGYEN